MKNITLNVYDDEKVVKTLVASEYKLKFGTVRKLMKLLNLDNTDNSLELLRTINETWDELTAILNKVFDTATEDDWDNVYVEELLPVVVQIAKYSLSQALHIPTEKN